MENEQLKKKGKRSGGGARSYNMNKRKCEQEDTTEHDDIRREAWTKTSEPPHYNTDGILHQCAATADITTCYICGNKLADSHTEYTRKTRDVKNGVLTETEWEIRRRYCRKCQMYCSAEPPGTLPNERFGIIIISQILIMRCMGMTYDKIMQILQMVYGERTVSSTLTGISERTAKRFWPLYNSLLDQIIDSELISGDESGWFLDGTHCWTWVLVSNSVVFYNITPTRGKNSTYNILEGLFRNHSIRFISCVEPHRQRASEVPHTLFSGSVQYKGPQQKLRIHRVCRRDDINTKGRNVCKGRMVKGRTRIRYAGTSGSYRPSDRRNIRG